MKTAAIFSDNMVLQREVNIWVFGSCVSGEREISVCIPELHTYADAVVTGNRWEAVLPPMPSYDSCTLKVVCGEQERTFRNVAIGEVWLAGGQSNMEFELRNDKNGGKELKSCSHENVRYYYTPKCGMNDEKLLEAESRAAWSLPSEESSRAWSAVGYYFAKELSRKLGCTVGVIGCNWGGTSASAWVPREVLAENTKLLPYLEDYDKATAGKSEEQMIEEYDEYLIYQAEWDKKMQSLYAERPDVSWAEVESICGKNRYPGPLGIKNPMRPCGLYETMVSRVCPYTVRGVLWYQGESDDHRPNTYYDLMSALIRRWREDWHNDEMAFLIVQLPMFRYKEDPDYKNWAVIREAQMKLFRTVRNTGIAVALDCGEFDNIHPVDKSQVGHRLYLQAMSEVYGLMEREHTMPPVYLSHETRRDTLIIYLKNYCRHNALQGSDSCKEGFEVAGADGVYYPADHVVIAGEQIQLKSDRVNKPLNARFKWTNYASVGLFGSNGIPVAPFRTDDLSMEDKQ